MELKSKLNWGGFWLTWIWGIRNKVYIALLGIIPVVNLFIAFYLLFRGNDLAKSKGKWFSDYDYISTQRKWNKGGFTVFLIVMAVAVYFSAKLLIPMVVSYSVESNVIRLINSDKELVNALGEDFEIISTDGVEELEISKKLSLPFIVFEAETDTHEYELSVDLFESYKPKHIKITDENEEEILLIIRPTADGGEVDSVIYGDD